MATQDFTLNGRKYVNGGKAILNGKLVRKWAQYLPGDNCWIYDSVRYVSRNLTRQQIADEFVL